MEPLEKSVSPESFEKIFCNIREIRLVNKSFLEHLQKGSDVANIAEAFVKFATKFKFVYSIFCKDHQISKTVISDLKAADSSFDNFLAICLATKPECRKLDLEAFLIKPIQRLCRYPLFLKELLKYAEPETTEHQNLSAALNEISSVCDEVNEQLPDLRALAKATPLRFPFGDKKAARGSNGTIKLKKKKKEKKEESSEESDEGNKKEWEIHYTEEGHKYYWNTKTNSSTWDPPAELLEQSPSATPESLHRRSSSGSAGQPESPLGSDKEDKEKEDVLLLTYTQKEGTLEKGFPGSGWKKKFFVLKDGVLFQYSSKMQLQLMWPVGVCQFTEYKTKKDNDFCFFVKNPIKSFILRATSEWELHSWLNMFLRHKLLMESITSRLLKGEIKVAQVFPEASAHVSKVKRNPPSAKPPPPSRALSLPSIEAPQQQATKPPPPSKKPPPPPSKTRERSFSD
jgi:hypothetical protein